jgi:hypothetical protein
MLASDVAAVMADAGIAQAAIAGVSLGGMIAPANRTSFNADFRAMITRIAWAEVWGRPGPATEASMKPRLTKKVRPTCR